MATEDALVMIQMIMIEVLGTRGRDFNGQLSMYDTV